jgi:hypothetical protein
MEDKIYIQIASYRDPELVPTIRDCIAKAKNPNRLTFGICWQRDENESLEEFVNYDNFNIIDIPWNESKGLCWARSLLQKLWKGEKYTMQLDSHHRFLQDWDEHLIKMMELTGSPKPIITAYAGMYSPKENRLLNEDPYKMVPDKFTDSGTILFYPHSIENWKSLDKPVLARFVSGHFFFTLGEHCREYKYDPNLYFAGDEISLSIRSYTLGYDLFHPHYTVIWHEYTREGRTKHWTDFDNDNKESGKVAETWWEMDTKSKKRLRHMLQEEHYDDVDLGSYGLGTVRTHNDYQLYAGIHFKNRKLHPDAKKGVNPPINDTSEWYTLVEVNYERFLELPELENKEVKFIYVGVEDQSGNVLFRQDLQQYIPIVKAKFTSVAEPYKWVFWPVDKEGNWLDKQEFKW